VTPWLFTLKRGSEYAVMVGDDRIGKVTHDRLTRSWFPTDSTGAPVENPELGRPIAYGDRSDAVDALVGIWTPS
jgi:hypothetical protein